MGRFEADGMLTAIGDWNKSRGYRSTMMRHPLGDGTIAKRIFETRRPGRIDSYANAAGPLGDYIRSMGWRSSVGAPLIVDGRLWGCRGRCVDRRAAFTFCHRGPACSVHGADGDGDRERREPAGVDPARG